MSDSPAFKDSRAYPVVFMLILSALLTFILALSYHLSQERVETYKQVSFQKQLLAMFSDVSNDLSAKNLDNIDATTLNNLYAKHISEQSYQGSEEDKYYLFQNQGHAGVYVFPLSVKGLWSTIEILAAVDTNFASYAGIKIIQQGETPGLGARITEDWFQAQFKGKPFFNSKEFISLTLVEENETAKSSQIKQITGATASSRAVVDGVQTVLQEIYKKHFTQQKGVLR